MTSPKIRADHEALSVIADEFEREANQTRQTLQHLQSELNTLQSGDWIGQGAQAFFREMNGDVLPTLKRLGNALETAQQTTRQISRLLREAEEEAARWLRGEGGGHGASASVGTSASVGAGMAAPGDGGGGGGGGAAGGGGAGEGSFAGRAWDYIRQNASFKGEGKIYEIDWRSGKPKGGFSPELGFKYGVDGSVLGDAKASDGWSALGGEAGAKFGVGKDGVNAGAYAELYAAKAQADAVFVGGRDLGLTGAAEGKVLHGEAFAGIKDSSFGAGIGGTLISAKGEVGLNVAGANVGVNGEIGLKAELGFRIGKRTELKLPFVTIGFSFGGAKD